MSIADSIISRTYKCDHCKSIIQYDQKASEKWKKKCPLCKKHKLYLDSADSNMSLLMDNSKPKTIGSLGQKNYEDAKRRGTLPKEINNPTPYWRKGRQKINYKVLKNPSWYIKTGSTS